MRSYSSKSSRRGSAPRKSNDPLPPRISLDTWMDILGVVLLGLAALTLFGLLSTQRSPLVGDWVAFTNRLFGWGVYLAPLVLGAVGLYLLIRRFGDRFPRLRPTRIGGAVLAYLSALAITHGLAVLITAKEGSALAADGRAGGEVGWAILSLLTGLLGNTGAGLVLVLAAAAGVMLMLGMSADQLLQALQRLRTMNAPTGSAPSDDIIEPKRSGLIIRGLKPRRLTRRPADSPMPVSEAVPVANPPTLSAGDQPTVTQPMRNRSSTLPPPRIIGGSPDNPRRSEPAQAELSAPPPNAATPSPAMAGISSIYQRARAWQLPRIEALLMPGSDASVKESEIRQRAALIEQTLLAFGVPGRVVEVNRGPTITQFGIEPGFNETKGGKQTKVKVSRIAALADDLALALAVPRVRIEAPIPGRALVGIEVPNSEASLVALRDVMESEEFEALRRKTRLALALGQDVSGRPVVADLTSMPHLLIAGTTGSGKSVCINAILCALLCTNSPNDLRLLLIDPKRVELIGYNGIPHLVAPVVVELDKATQALQWVTREMDGRYRLFARYSARNISEFNAKVEGNVYGLQKLPYIVVVIDELADLMMTAPDETEKVICRLAQMARATGIHLILATQRPSVDVVTGLIKANFPARIAFTVATSVDSRVILDSPGAEKLLGRGDMLFVTPDQPMPTRAQGCYLSGSEIERVVRHWRAQLDEQPLNSERGFSQATTGDAPEAEASWSVLPTSGLFSGPPTWEEARSISQATNNDKREDRLFNDAVATVRMHGKASISLLQRRLRIGYTRAARLIEEMEERGIVGPAVPGQQYREVLNAPLGKDQDDA